MRGLKWFAVGFLLPLVVILGLEVLLRDSPVPRMRRLLTLEDTCSYGGCFVIAAAIYLGGLITVRARRDRET